MCACDHHDKTLVLKLAEGTNSAIKRVFSNDWEGRMAMQRELLDRSKAAGGAPIVFAYEASGQGFGLYDELTLAGMICHVLAPTRIARSPQHRRRKSDDRDAEQILELLRGHVLAGNPLPTVWVPDRATRDDRELIRTRLDAGEKLAALKAQVQSLLKRHGMRWTGQGRSWTKKHREWLKQLSEREVVLDGRPDQSWGRGAGLALRSLLRQIEHIEQEIETLDAEVEALAQTPRYALAVQSLNTIKGVGPLTAMVFLTEVGDLSRFSNRRQLAAYLGLIPSSNESGECGDRKGHITRQGPSRVRKVLCQSVWSAIRCDPQVRDTFDKMVRRNPKAKKIAVVACMRRLSIRMWRRGLARTGPPAGTCAA
jgi:transposase